MISLILNPTTSAAAPVVLDAPARQRKRAERLGPLLRVTEHALLRKILDEIHRLEAVRRYASERLKALDAGGGERFPSEVYCARQALDAVAYDLPRAVAAWLLLAFGPPSSRTQFTLHPEQREDMVSRIIRLRGLFDAYSCWRELEAFL